MFTNSDVARRRARAGFAALALMLMPLAAGAQTTWSGFLAGTNENPSNSSTASGFVSLTLIANSLTVQLNFTGLTTSASAAHIHCCVAPGNNAPVAVNFLNFPASTSGTYSSTFDLTSVISFSSSFLAFGGGTAAGAEAALIAGLNAGQAYVNIHNSTFPGGEIRANVALVTPEPSSVLLIGAGLLSVGAVARRRKRAA